MYLYYLCPLQNKALQMFVILSISAILQNMIKFWFLPLNHKHSKKSLYLHFNPKFPIKNLELYFVMDINSINTYTVPLAT
jgi:hypothetical protein